MSSEAGAQNDHPRVCRLALWRLDQPLPFGRSGADWPVRRQFPGLGHHGAAVERGDRRRALRGDGERQEDPAPDRRDDLQHPRPRWRKGCRGPVAGNARRNDGAGQSRDHRGQARRTLDELRPTEGGARRPRRHRPAPVFRGSRAGCRDHGAAGHRGAAVRHSRQRATRPERSARQAHRPARQPDRRARNPAGRQGQGTCTRIGGTGAGQITTSAGCGAAEPGRGTRGRFRSPRGRAGPDRRQHR